MAVDYLAALREIMALPGQVLSRLTSIEADIKGLQSGVKSLIGRSMAEAKRDKDMAKKQAKHMEDLIAAAEENSNATEAAVELLTKLGDMLEQAQEDDDPEKVTQIVDQLKSQSRKLAEAITANTPFDPSGNDPKFEPSGNQPK